jgi:predicted transglutaminase-like cysteine proteinase
MNLFSLRSAPLYRLSVFLIAALINGAVIQRGLAGEFVLSEQVLTKIEQQYGDYARRRVAFWQKLMTTNGQADDLEKLRLVNDFFNQLKFVNDIDHWGKEDYWATPLQMLATNGGDCEDFSIAKYFTLREMGIPAERLRLTYVKALKLDQAHMVLTYYPTADADPLVLDNLEASMRTASERDDLQPVYSFNGEGLWLAKSHGASMRVGRSERLSRWTEVIARIDREEIPLAR